MELLERESALATLRTILDDAASGNGRVALVGGEAGNGKTALVERFTRDHRDAARILGGACDALFSPRPLGPLHDIAAQTQGELLAALQSDANRQAAFSACLSEFQRGLTIVFFEDVHRADETTLDLLKFLGRRIQRTSTLLIATYRDDELSSQHPLRTVLGDLATSAATRRLSLAPLSAMAMRQLVGERSFDAALLHQRTAGNPFYVTEIIAGESGGIPLTVRDAVLARAARLSPSACAVLEAGAVIGAHMEPWLLAEVTGAEATAMDECLAIGVLLAQGQLLVFHNELARQTILVMQLIGMGGMSKPSRPAGRPLPCLKRRHPSGTVRLAMTRKRRCAFSTAITRRPSPGAKRSSRSTASLSTAGSSGGRR